MLLEKLPANRLLVAKFLGLFVCLFGEGGGPKIICGLSTAQGISIPHPQVVQVSAILVLGF